MKKVVLFSAIALMACACAKTIVEEPVIEQKEVFTVTATVPKEADTKTHLNMSSAPYKMTWTAGDKIFVGNEDNILAATQGNNCYTLSSGEGSDSGTFTLTSGATVAAGEVIAIYPCNPTRMVDYSMGQSVVITVPESQNYVAGGVQDGYVPMVAHGDRDNLHFSFLGAILSFGLTDDDQRVVSKISVITNEKCAGQMMSSLALMQTNGYSLQRARDDSATRVIDYTVGTKLDKVTPTYFNIVMLEGEYNKLQILVYCEDGSMMELRKEFQIMKRGMIHNKGSYEYTPTPPSQISFTVDGVGEVINLNALATTVVAEHSTLVFSSERSNHVITDAEVETIASWVKTNEKEVGIDLSGVSYPSTTFGTQFRYNDYIWSLSLPNNIQVTEASLRDCKGVRYVTLPSTVTTITGGFLLNDYVVSIFIPKNVTSIGNYALSSGCGAFSVDEHNEKFSVLNEALIKDGSELVAYPNRSDTEKYTIPDEAESIASYAFYGAKNLTEIYIPDTSLLRELKYRSLCYLNYLESITCDLKGSAIPTCAADLVYGGIRRGGTLYVPSGEADAYYAAGWRQLVDSYGWTITDGSYEIGSSKASLGSISAE